MAHMYEGSSQQSWTKETNAKRGVFCLLPMNESPTPPTHSMLTSRSGDSSDFFGRPKQHWYGSELSV